MDQWFQKGDYPIRQVIFCELDSVLGSLLTGMLKDKHGRIDILHQLRSSEKQTDLDLLLSTTRTVVSTCWTETRTLDVLPEYVKKRGWQPDDVRVYVLGRRVRKFRKEPST